jgi:hypothetical protein
VDSAITRQMKRVSLLLSPSRLYAMPPLERPSWETLNTLIGKRSFEQLAKQGRRSEVGWVRGLISAHDGGSRV